MILRFAAAVLALVVCQAAGAAQHVVALGGAVTETVCALGQGAVLAGVDQTSRYPAETAALPQVGYVRTLAAEGILSLRPDLVLAGPEAGPTAVLDQLDAAGVPLVRLPQGFSPEAALARIKAIGSALGVPARADALTASLAAEIEQARAAIAKTPSHPRVLFLLSVGRGAPLVSGSGTAADAMIGLAGGINAVSGYAGYKPLSPEAAVAANPDVVLTTSDSIDALGGADAVLHLPELASTAAAATGRLVRMDALYMLGFGPRLPQALVELAASLHPETRFAAVGPPPKAVP